MIWKMWIRSTKPVANDSGHYLFAAVNIKKYSPANVGMTHSNQRYFLEHSEEPYNNSTKSTASSFHYTECVILFFPRTAVSLQWKSFQNTFLWTVSVLLAIIIINNYSVIFGHMVVSSQPNCYTERMLPSLDVSVNCRMQCIIDLWSYRNPPWNCSWWYQPLNVTIVFYLNHKYMYCFLNRFLLLKIIRSSLYWQEFWVFNVLFNCCSCFSDFCPVWVALPCKSTLPIVPSRSCPSQPHYTITHVSDLSQQRSACSETLCLSFFLFY